MADVTSSSHGDTRRSYPIPTGSGEQRRICRMPDVTKSSPEAEVPAVPLPGTAATLQV
jgi:hypothetical protein